MPKLWTATIEAHRHEVRVAILATTAALVAEYGLLSVTMSQIAEHAGIGRATLYKYFPDVETILLAWHERTISSHLEHLVHVRDHAGDNASARLEAVLGRYALLDHEHHGSDRHRDHLRDPMLSAFLHSGRHIARAQDELGRMISGLIRDAARVGEVRDDVAPTELASYCLNALATASSMTSKAAVRRLVGVTLDGLRSR